MKILFLTLEIVDSKYCYQHAGHIVTWDLKIITVSRIGSIICKGPKYRFPLPIDFKSCREESQEPYKNFVIARINESFLRYSGYLNFINDPISRVLLLVLVHEQLLSCLFF